MQWHIRYENTGESAEEAGAVVEELSVTPWAEGSFGESGIIMMSAMVVRQPLGFPQGGGLMLRRIRDDVGATRPDSMRTGTRGGNGTKGRHSNL